VIGKTQDPRSQPVSIFHRRLTRTSFPYLLIGVVAAVYAYHLGREPLAASEAYSALAAAQPSASLVAHTALGLDPGKPVFYHLLLHWFCRWTGRSEAALRSLSVVFGVISVWMVFLLGEDLFGFEVGWSAAILWAVNPLAAVLARWARMYSMLIALALGHVLAMEKVRRGAGALMLLLAGLLGGAMVYVHLGGALIVAADMVVIARELRRSGKTRTWPALALTCVLCLPFFPIMLAQTRALLFGHWMDWLGVNQARSIQKLILAPAAGALLWLMLACPAADERRERLQQCLIYSAVPTLALLSGSVLIRPMFEVRYVSPSCAVLAVVAACWLDRAGARVRNLGTVAISALCLMLLPLIYSAAHEPWPAIASRIASTAQAGEPIFFKAGFFSAGGGELHADDDNGFPQGFFRVPFDYYFHRNKPRLAVPLSDPAMARKLIASRLAPGAGAWLVSARQWPDALAELPHGQNVHVDYAARFSRISVFHVRLVRAVVEISPATEEPPGDADTPMN
jgi:uncharacterized membrane protein